MCRVVFLNSGRYKSAGKRDLLTCTQCHNIYRLLEKPLSYVQQEEGDLLLVSWKCMKCDTVQKSHVKDSVMITVEAYRRYYQGSEKRNLVSWKHGNIPTWFKKETEIQEII